MASTNTANLELAFNELIDELSKVRDLAALAETYKEKAEIISLSLEKFLKLADLKYEKLEQTVFNENADISTIKDNINFLQTFINSQIEAVNSEVANSVSNLNDILSSHKELITGISLTIANNHDESLIKSKEFSEEIRQNQKTCIENLIASINSVKVHMSNIKDALYPTLEKCRKGITEATNDILSKIDVNIEIVSNSINDSQNQLLKILSDVRHSISVIQENVKSEISRTKEEILLSTTDKSNKLDNDLMSLSELVKQQDSSIKKNNEGVSSSIELIKESIKSVSNSRDILKSEIMLLFSKLEKLFSEQSEYTESVKVLINNCSDSVHKDIWEKNSQLKEYLINEYKNLNNIQSKTDNNIHNLEIKLLDGFVQLSEKIDKNNKTNTILLIIIIVLLSIYFFYSICR